MVSTHHVNHEYSPFSALYNVKIRHKNTANEANMGYPNVPTCYDKNVSKLEPNSSKQVSTMLTSRKPTSQSEEKKKSIKSDSTYCTTSYFWNADKDGSENDSLVTVKKCKRKSTKNRKNSTGKQCITKKKSVKSDTNYVEKKQSSLNKKHPLAQKKNKQISLERPSLAKLGECRKLEKAPSRLLLDQKHVMRTSGKDANGSEDEESIYSFQRPIINKRSTKQKKITELTKTGTTGYMKGNSSMDSLAWGTTSLNTFAREVSQCESLSEDRMFQRLGPFQTADYTNPPEISTTCEGNTVIENLKEKILKVDKYAHFSSIDSSAVKPRDGTFWKKWFALRGWSTDLEAPTTEEMTLDNFQSFPSHLTKEITNGTSFASVFNGSHGLHQCGSKGTPNSLERLQKNQNEETHSINQEENINRRPERIAAQLRSYVTLLHSPGLTKDSKKLECEKRYQIPTSENIQNVCLKEEDKLSSTSYAVEKLSEENDGDGISTSCHDVVETWNERKQVEGFKNLPLEELKTDGSFFVLQDEKKTCSLLHAKNMIDSDHTKRVEKEGKCDKDTRRVNILNILNQQMNTARNSSNCDTLLPEVHSCLCSKSSQGEGFSIQEEKLTEHKDESFQHDPLKDPTSSTYDDGSVKTIQFGSEEANLYENENFPKTEDKNENIPFLAKQLTLNGPLLLSHISKEKSYRSISSHHITVPRFYSKSVLINFSKQLEKKKLSPFFLKLYSDGIEDIHLTQWLPLDTRGLRKVTCKYIKAMGWTFKIIFLWSLVSMLLVFTVSTVQTKQKTSFLIMYWTLCVFYFITSLFFLIGPVKPTCEIYKKSWMFLMNQQLVIKCFSHICFRKIIISYHNQLDDLTMASFYSTPRLHNKRFFQCLLISSHFILFLIFFILIKVISTVTGTMPRRLDYGINFVLTWFVGIFSLFYTLNLYSIEEFSESSKLLAINKILALVEVFNCSAFLNVALKKHDKCARNNSFDQIQLQSHCDINNFQMKQFFQKTSSTSFSDSCSILSSPYMKQYPLWKFFFGGIVVLWRKDQETDQMSGILFLQLEEKQKSYASIPNIPNYSFAILIYNASKQRSQLKNTFQPTEIVINYLTQITPIKDMNSGIVLLKLKGLSQTNVQKGCFSRKIPSIKHIFISIPIHEACILYQAFSYLTSKLDP